MNRLEYRLQNNPDLAVRLNAIDALVEYSDLAPDSFINISSPLIHSLANDEAFELRVKAAFISGEEDYKSATDALVTALHEDESTVVRSTAAEALVKLGGDDALKALMRALKEDESPDVRGV